MFEKLALLQRGLWKSCRAPGERIRS